MENGKEERRKECRIQWPSTACQQHTLLLALFVFRAFCFEQFCIFSRDVEYLAKTSEENFVIAKDKTLGRNRHQKVIFSRLVTNLFANCDSSKMCIRHWVLFKFCPARCFAISGISTGRGGAEQGGDALSAGRAGRASLILGMILSQSSGDASLYR